MVHRGHLEAEGEKTSVMLAGDASRIMCVNFMCQGPARGRVRQLVGHMDNVAVFSNGNGEPGIRYEGWKYGQMRRHVSEQLGAQKLFDDHISSLFIMEKSELVDKALQSMEEEAECIYKDERGLLHDDEAASTRDAMYEQSELIERELEQMTEQIKSVIQSLNSNQGGEHDTLDGMTPLDAVVRILNNQLTSLMWIDEKAEEFSSRIQKLANPGSATDRELTGLGIWMS
ncbi:Nuclear pore glycoprotein p62 [Glycine soja]|uniref:Nuclear pore glycoprotein p62 n=1 Tax=Glycine soja TaxID=3848 RepID=A0A0B2SAS0_GLYSO|nr:Nuclear pore glycoprotein p62 [Glycine soja]